MRTTEKERKMLQAICDSDFQSYDDPTDCPVWAFDVCDKAGLGDGAGGVMASLVKKGLAGHDDHAYDDDTCWITAAGIEALKA